jgi:hypothetical protein
VSSTHLPLAVALAATVLLVGGGCGNNPFTACSEEPDLTGHWVLTIAPTDGGVAPAGDTIDAQLMQVKRGSGLGALVWGTLTSSDKGAFDTLNIPQLMHNNGSKTGGVLGCELRINVPVDTPVTDDDNDDDGPLRLSLSGSISAQGMLAGDLSTMIRVDDPTMTQGSFTWTGAEQ